MVLRCLRGGQQLIVRNHVLGSFDLKEARTWRQAAVALTGLLGVCLLAGAGLAATCEGRFAGGTEDFTEERLGTSLVIGQSDARYGLTLAALGAYIAEVGFGFQVETVVLAAEDVPAALGTGRVDVVLNARQPDSIQWFENAVETGEILSTGPIYTEDGFSFSGATTPRLAEVGPDLLEAFRAMEVPIERLKQTDDWFHESGIVGNHRAAIYFLWNFNYEDSWKSWMPWDPAERLRDATERYTGLRYPEEYDGIEYDLDRFSRSGREQEE